MKKAMSELCLREGSVLAPAAEHLLRLYSMRFCPYAERTRLVLIHKRIPHEIVNVNLKYKPSWFLERNPLGLVPVIEHERHIIYESIICDQFLEEKFPEPQLTPSCPFKRAEASLLMFNFDNDVAHKFHGMLSKKPENREKAQSSISTALRLYNKRLQDHKTKYFQGDTCGMVDFHFWPWFERFPAMTQLSGTDFLQSGKYTGLDKWIQNMEQLEAVQKTKLPTDWHMEFLVSLAQRDPKYDIGLPDEAKL